MVIGRGFGNCRDDGNIVALRADVVCTGNNGNVDIYGYQQVKSAYSLQTYHSFVQLEIEG